MIRDIQAKVLLSSAKTPDPWFGIKYTMNLYRGCQHRCIYCDSRSECYQIEQFDRDVLVKANALELLPRELAGKRTKGVVGTGSMNDPYMPLEAERNLAGRALEIIAQHRFPVHIITKSDLVVRDLETLVEIGRVYAAVSFTITTVDDDLARKIEPGAPPPSARLRALETLAGRGVCAGVTLMPVLPFIEDNEDNISQIVARAGAAGASYIIASFGMTLRDRQRAYYYERLDQFFPGLRAQYEQRFGERYSCAAPGAGRLQAHFAAMCERAGVATRMPMYAPDAPRQLGLF